MAIIAIRDLTESTDLDRQAMAAIIGGARIGARYSFIPHPAANASRVVDYPPGFPAARHPVAEGVPAPVQSILRK
jgi:hypothetical protein